ncbi:succinylglutamate desuccinylase/aspartoacylase family protein [Nonlabens sp. Ci31]|jgi:predicted deacylase|uniref:succinylglutamate desuccinylase/aspartoacylase family protein n=1 Tax=Nonlabens sp. Ci31 TaxID=2608253 RepID=UPI0014644F30|nr:succinylglutamate desuccinylase/aspartoacylase family protein [Nonlabens sp. Ci31]QJP35243.1 succinylglutamate desuccinylase/aspartoacylase family protein [Nonlabens sp. Ci31]
MHNSSIEVLGKVISEGKGLQINLDIAKLHTRTKIEVPIIIERAKEPGPTILITGGIHGDEINGVEIVRQLVAKGYHKPQKGMVICIPVVNIFGFLNQTRQFPDGRDLNRVFPGSKRGSLASIFAYHLMKEIVPLADYCLDFHTGGADRFNAPQVRINEGDEESLELAKIFGAPFIMKSKRREKSYRDSAIKLGKKVLLFEGGKSLDIDKSVTKVGVKGALNLMHHLGIRDFSKELASKAKVNEPIVVASSKWIRASYSGMFRSNAVLGRLYNKGDKIGSISDPFGFFEKDVKAPVKGYVFCINRAPVVNKGDAVIHMSIE